MTLRTSIGSGVEITETVNSHGTTIGIIVWHHTGIDGTMCGGAVMFDRPEIRAAHPMAHFWTVVKEEPLTLTPSIRCPQHPHFHGEIKEGRWVASR